MLCSLAGEEFYEASPYEPATSRLADIFRLASIFSGEWAGAGASLVLLSAPPARHGMARRAEPWAWPRRPAGPPHVSEPQVLICQQADIARTGPTWSAAFMGTSLPGSRSSG